MSFFLKSCLQCCKLHLRLYDLILWNMGRICVRSRNVLQYVSRHNDVSDVSPQTKHSPEHFFYLVQNRVCHGFRLMKGDDYFHVDFDHF